MGLKKIFTLSWVICFCAFVNGQDNGLKGVVLETDDKGNILPIHGATAHWMNTSIGASTDSNGIFHIPFTEETKRLVVSYVGFKTDTIFVANKNYVKVIMISKNRLNEVDIVIQRKSTEISYLDPWKTTIMNEKELFKQACCNLAESFETNPSVDVAISDAITGTKQIQMLGLASQYTQVTQEYMPSIRGLATNYGFSYTPGTWLNSIQVTKGVGSVVNGYESISGLINTELHKPDVKDKLFLNLYAGQGGRYEINLNLAQQVNASFSHSILTHYSTITNRTDHNNDGYLDNPLGEQINLLYRWKWNITKSFMFQGGVRVLYDTKRGGMFDYNGTKDYSPTAPMYGTDVFSQRLEGFVKLGYVFPKKVYKSLGLQMSGVEQNFITGFGSNTYNGNQKSLYGNLIYQSIIGSSDHKFRTGFSNQSDWFDETFIHQLYATNYDSTYYFKRNEIVTGGFFEYSFTPSDNITLVGGMRADYNNLFGMFYTPRFHLRYVIAKNSVLRFSAGTGQRTANLLAENTGLMVSSRKFVFNGNQTAYGFGFKPERAANYGLNFTHEFKFNYRPGTITFDYYFTDFMNQVVVDRDANAQQVLLYSLQGKSYSSSFQVQLDYEPVRRFDVRLAFRYYDVSTQYQSGMLQVPLVAKQRGFVNLAYQTKSKWAFDGTLQLNGQKRLPTTAGNPSDKQMVSYSPFFYMVNGQITKSFKSPRLDLYAGVENIFNFMQHHPIIDGNNPYGMYFDASMIWGPVFGRMVYGGVRFRL